jgi:HAE1 family hydrophobic/amphiphilic exporter-1
VAKVEVEGAPQNEVEIAIDQDRLNAHGLALNELDQRLRAVNFSVSAGQIDDGTQRLRVQPVGELTDLQQLRDLVLAERRAPVRRRRRAPEAGKDALRPSPRRTPGGRHRRLQGTRRQPRRRLARVRAELDAIKAEAACPTSTCSCSGTPAKA